MTYRLFFKTSRRRFVTNSRRRFKISPTASIFAGLIILFPPGSGLII